VNVIVGRGRGSEKRHVGDLVIVIVILG